MNEESKPKHCVSDRFEMSGLALSRGTLLPVLQGKKVYQPIWQIIAVNNSQSSGNFSNQILVSDGELSRVDTFLQHDAILSYHE